MFLSHPQALLYDLMQRSSFCGEPAEDPLTVCQHFDTDAPPYADALYPVGRMRIAHFVCSRLELLGENRTALPSAYVTSVRSCRETLSYHDGAWDLLDPVNRPIAAWAYASCPYGFLEEGLNTDMWAPECGIYGMNPALCDAQGGRCSSDVISADDPTSPVKRCFSQASWYDEDWFSLPASAEQGTFLHELRNTRCPPLIQNPADSPYFRT
jgi:hypothetical protein